jgi:beta-lactamase regulating signal transducer with metallopeptidase domain
MGEYIPLPTHSRVNFDLPVGNCKGWMIPMIFMEKKYFFSSDYEEICDSQHLAIHSNPV